MEEETKTIDRNMTISEILGTWPHKSQKLAQEMTQFGLHCVGCGAATFETLEAGMKGHGLEEEDIVNLVGRLNEVLAEETDPTKITLTKRAAVKFQEIAKEEGKEGFGLRFGDKPGGCSGFEYTLDFESTETVDSENTQTFHAHGVDIFVDKSAVSRLIGAEIDYLDGLTGSGFKVSNPNVKGSCGCGHSQTY